MFNRQFFFAIYKDGNYLKKKKSKKNPSNFVISITLISVSDVKEWRFPRTSFSPTPLLPSLLKIFDFPFFSFLSSLHHFRGKETSRRRTIIAPTRVHRFNDTSTLAVLTRWAMSERRPLCLNGLNRTSRTPPTYRNSMIFYRQLEFIDEFRVGSRGD